MAIKKGDYVIIKPEWRDPGDAAMTFVARTDEEKGRLDISALELSNMTFWPMHVVRVDMLMTREQTVTALAEAFAEVMRQCLSADEMAEVKRRNAHYSDKVCATHDFCDANMVMDAAFRSTTGRDPLAGDDGMSEADCRLWSDALALAKKLYFT